MIHQQQRLMMHQWLKALLACLLVLSMSAGANPLRIAVASNFRSTLEQILPAFEEANPGIDTQIITGSTGALYAQISHGAPYDLLLAADAERPRKLLAENKALEVFHYATGQLAFWATGKESQVDELTLRQGDSPIAVANPNTAPYGTAAQQALASMNIAGKKLITGSNVNQSYQFIESGNVATGFVALSQLINRIDSLQWWLVPQNHYEPIVQLGALLPNHHTDATIFVKFLLSAPTQKAIFDRGYIGNNSGTNVEYDELKQTSRNTAVNRPVASS